MAILILNYILSSVLPPILAASSRVACVTFWLIGSLEEPRGGELRRQTACYDICVAFFLILLCEYVAHYS